MARRYSKSKAIDTRTEEEQQQDRSRRLRYIGPWAITALGPVLVEGGHLAVAGNPAALALATLGIAGTGAGLGRFLTHLDTKAKRDKDTVHLHQANTVLVTAAVTLGTITGVDTAATAGTWMLGGVGLSLANNLWSSFYKKGSDKGASKWEKLESEIGLAKHELEEAKSNGKGTVTVKVRAKDGATADELSRKIPAMASVLRLGQGRITQTVNDDDSGDITMRVQVADLLKEGFPWPGPSAFGTGIGDTPLHLGRYEDGETLKVNLPGVLRDPQELRNGNVEHAIAQGTNGAGKTQGNCILVGDAATRTEVSTIIINCSKFSQDYGHVRHAADMVIQTEAEARRFFKQLHTVIKARADYLGSKGLSKWKPGCGLNFLLIIGEEAADFADGDAYAKVLRTLRSTGGWFESSIQRATHDQMDTTARSNHPAGMAYGLTDGADAQYILPPDAIEAGAFPGWGNRKPGYLYAAGMGIKEDRWAVVARTYNADRAQLAAAVTAGMNVRTPMDQVTADAFGPLWTKRTVFTTPLLEADDDAALPQEPHHPAPPAAPSGTAAAPAAAHGTDEDEDGDEAMDLDAEEVEEMIRKETEDMDDALQQILASDPEPGEYEHLSVEQEIEAPADDAPVFSLPGVVSDEDKLTSEDCRSAILTQLDTWVREGKGSFEPKELNHLWMRVDLAEPRSWWNRLRSKLIADGVISKDESEDGYGSYDLIRSPFEENNGE